MKKGRPTGWPFLFVGFLYIGIAVMGYNCRHILVGFLMIVSLSPYSQNRDSLGKVWNDKNKSDLTRLDAVQELMQYCFTYNPDTVIVLGEQELQLSKKGNSKKHKRYTSMGYKAIGLAYYYKGNYPKALANYFESLKLAEEIKNTRDMVGCYLNLGNVYLIEHKTDLALEYYFKGLKVLDETKDNMYLGNCYGSIGNVYLGTGVMDSALKYYLKAVKMQEVTDDKEGLGNCYGNIGTVYQNKGEFEKALEYQFKAIEINEQIGDLQGMGVCYGNISTVYNRMGDFKKAIEYSEKELKLCKKIGDLEGLREAYQNLSIAYSKTGKYKEAYESHVNFKNLTDSIFNEENSKQLGDLKTQFEVEKKETELKIKAQAEQEKLVALANEEKKRQNVIIFSVGGVLILVIIFSIFLFNRFRLTQKQKIIIEKQKEQVDHAYESLHEKNKEIMDSINYASRIQRALLPSKKYIVSNLNRLKRF
ncbi:MAG: tetratricopeptide repeat protein [Bacteroidia bacterium]